MVNSNILVFLASTVVANTMALSTTLAFLFPVIVDPNGGLGLIYHHGVVDPHKHVDLNQHGDHHGFVHHCGHLHNLGVVHNITNTSPQIQNTCLPEQEVQERGDINLGQV